jgi:hypothetical protein
MEAVFETCEHLQPEKTDKKGKKCLNYNRKGKNTIITPT